MSMEEDARPPNQDPGPRGTLPGTPSDRQSLLNQLRDANEELVVSSMRAQDLADQAEASRAEAQAANRLKDEFLAVVSHELRNPLNAVLGWARLLVGGQLASSRMTEAMVIIERNATALARIIDDLLDVSRLVGGTVRIETRPVDLVAVVQGALDEVRPGAQSKGLHLTFTCPVIPNPVAGDAIRLQQVVANLLTNAIKFTPAQGHVEVMLTSADAQATIQVIDTGQGIGPEFLPHIFERFSQGDSSTTRRQGGIGLGLAIVRALVERHGGTVQAESPGAGRGATFTVRLPVLVGREADAAERRGVEGVRGPGEPPRLDGLRVVLVEDDPDGRHIMALILEFAGAQVTTAGSVREALAVLDTERPDVIVSDVGMPDEDGYSFIRRVRTRDVESGGTIPAVALTGYASAEDRARLLAAGFQTHLRKPVDPDEFVAAIAALASTPPRADVEVQ